MKRSRIYNRQKWRRRAERFVARGLNTRGKAYTQRQWRELNEMHGRARDLERDRRRYRERHAPQFLPSAAEQAWRAIRDSMGEIKTPEIVFGLERNAA